MADPQMNPSQDLGTMLHAAFRGLRHTWTEQLAPWGLAPGHWRALHTLQVDQGMRLKDLAERLRIAPRSATEVVDQLESRALVVRTPDPQDRRAVILTLTQTGRDLAEAIQAERRQSSDVYFAPLDAAEREQLATLLARLVEHHRGDGRRAVPGHVNADK